MFPKNLKMSSGTFFIKDMPLVTIQNEDLSRIEDNERLNSIVSGEFSSLAIDPSDPPHYIRSINRPLSASAECSFECEIDAQEYNRLIGFDASPFPDATGFSMIFSSPYQVQRRRHKKKRINKKWAKRYGYVTKFKKYRMDEVYFKESGKDEYDFYTKNVEVVK